MTPQWFADIAALVPRPAGDRSASAAVVAWAAQSPRDARLQHLIEDARPDMVARALRGGGWDGTGLDALAADLAAGGAGLVLAVDQARSHR